MSWLFGINNKKTDFADIAGITPPTPPPSGDSGGGDDKTKNKQGMEAYRFDSSALERAAAAAKELERTSN